MLDFESIGKVIHELRTKHGYSQDSLAELLGSVASGSFSLGIGHGSAYRGQSCGVVRPF